MTTANSNNRASLLAGLRTGGVRSVSASVPHTAAPAGSFNVPRFPSQYNGGLFPEEEEEDQLAELHQQTVYQQRNVPMTSAVDGPNNRFSQHQAARGMNPNSVPFSPGFASNMVPQAQMQMQMLQLEMMRIQAIQAQQYQTELLAQAQRQQHLQQLQQQQQQQYQAQQAQIRERRSSQTFNPPATAGPLTNSFDLRAATLSAQLRRANQADQLRSQLSVGSAPDDQVPMTAALGGRFGSRTASLNTTSNSNLSARFDEHSDPPPTSSSTTVISGGTSLGSPMSNNVSNPAPSKSDSVSSWRRGGNNNSVLSGNRAVSSPSVKVTPPPSEDRISPPPAASPVTASGPKFRPQPLRFSSAVSQPLPTVAIDNADEDTDGETQSSSSSAKSGSSPTTPRSSSSSETPLSPREEASKRLYEGLGIGRPVSATPSEQGQNNSNPSVAAAGHRMVSQPTRQPRGPPSGADELGPKNFATRIRRKAIGGLGMLMGARERREILEAF
ncbi:hypothetical protein BDN70DRAFT_903197 [Pholiota conissans]|uniref:Uncharacterized protein n=1 Tax=Pholiota conissans TaxID=109636 RepID=A0A9P5ZE86_9AGAR|nr:hypothetical protein BDN70DRAFT_903197 [Pholiota conissans]